MITNLNPVNHEAHNKNCHNQDSQDFKMNLI